MEYIWNTTDFRLKNTAVSLGKFDGFHRGHRLLVEYVTSLKKQGFKAVTFSFFVHPGFLMSSGSLKLIYTEEEKAIRAEELGSDYLISYPFNEEVMHMQPEQFVKNVLVDKLDVKAVVVGRDYCFGKNREGNVELLKKLGLQYGFSVKVFDKVILDGEEISSTRIRKALTVGHMEEVNKMLGAPYSIMGEVVYGNQVGRTLGMPTANMIPQPGKMIPPDGVYASRIHMDGKMFTGITNIGYKPTVSGKHKKGIETFIFDFQGKIYGKKIQVDLYAYERGEKKFDSLEKLKSQMKKDCDFSRQYFKSIGL